MDCQRQVQPIGAVIASRADKRLAFARGVADPVLLLIGFAGALRRSELVALQVEDLAAAGLRLRIRSGTTDPDGQGAEIGLPRGRHAETCPVRAFDAWQEAAGRQASASLSAQDL